MRCANAGAATLLRCVEVRREREIIGPAMHLRCDEVSATGCMVAPHSISDGPAMQVRCDEVHCHTSAVC